MKTGEFIRDLMSERGITARELSRRIGVSHVTIGKWLRNDFQPSGKNLETLAAFFSVTPAAIIFGEKCLISPRSLRSECSERLVHGLPHASWLLRT